MLANRLAELALPIGIVIIKKAKGSIPRGRDDIALSYAPPVDDARNIFLVFVLAAISAIWLFEFLHFSSILDVNAIDTAFLISDEKLSVTFIKAHASDISGANVPEHTLKTTVCCIPNFDAFGVRCHECVEDGVVQDTKARLVIGQVVVSRLVVVVEKHPPTTCNNSLGRLSDSEAVDFIRRAIEGLNSCEGAHVPDPEHA